jgi:hypothetical protein
MALPRFEAAPLSEVSSPLPNWFGKTVASLDELSRLPANWDSYGAAPVFQPAIRSAVSLLASVARQDTPAPAVVPTNRGAVLLEWHTRGIDLEVEIQGPNRMHVLFEDSHDRTQWEGDVGADWTRLTECIDRLSDVDRPRE